MSIKDTKDLKASRQRVKQLRSAARILNLKEEGKSFTSTRSLPGCPNTFIERRDLVTDESGNLQDTSKTIFDPNYEPMFTDKRFNRSFDVDHSSAIDLIDDMQFNGALVNIIVPFHYENRGLTDDHRYRVIYRYQQNFPTEILQKLLICCRYRKNNPEHPGMAQIAAYNEAVYKEILDCRGEPYEYSGDVPIYLQGVSKPLPKYRAPWEDEEELFDPEPVVLANPGKRRKRGSTGSEGGYSGDVYQKPVVTRYEGDHYAPPMQYQGSIGPVNLGTTSPL